MFTDPIHNDAIDWARLAQQLDQDGCAVIRAFLRHETCDEISALYDRPEPFRSKVVMARHGFGRGEYKYFKYPLPDPVARLRSALYPRLVPIANRQSLVRMHGPPDPLPRVA